jgi:hypothetical protein
MTKAEVTSRGRLEVGTAARSADARPPEIKAVHFARPNGQRREGADGSSGNCGAGCSQSQKAEAKRTLEECTWHGTARLRQRAFSAGVGHIARPTRVSKGNQSATGAGGLCDESSRGLPYAVRCRSDARGSSAS